MADTRTSTIWSNGGKHEWLVNDGDTTIARSGLIFNSRAAASRSLRKWAEENAVDDFEDNLPLDGEVYVEDDVRVYIYRGYLAGKPDQCAVMVKGEVNAKWVDRSKITPLADAK